MRFVEYNTKELLLIWLDSFNEISYNEKSELYEILKDEKSIKTELIKRSKDIPDGLRGKYDKILSSTDNGYLSIILKEMEEFGVVAVTKESKDYPDGLSSVEDSPLVLYCKGNKDLLKTKKFAIVGSRKSFPLSVAITKRYADAAAECGFTLITGIAEGVDGAVLTAAIDGGYPSISVLAGGLDDVYPKINKDLAEKISQNGLLISEYPIGTPAHKFHFPIRNRIIAALSDGVLIVSGGKKSGTVYTGEYALEYGKDLFAIPYSVGVESGITPNSFIKRNLAMLTDDPEDLFEFYGVEKKSVKDVLSNEELLIVNAIKEDCRHIEKIAEKLNKNVWEITPTVSMLEIKGVIIKSGVNEYSILKTVQEN